MPGPQLGLGRVGALAWVLVRAQPRQPASALEPALASVRVLAEVAALRPVPASALAVRQVSAPLWRRLVAVAYRQRQPVEAAEPVRPARVAVSGVHPARRRVPRQGLARYPLSASTVSLPAADLVPVDWPVDPTVLVRWRSQAGATLPPVAEALRRAAWPVVQFLLARLTNRWHQAQRAHPVQRSQQMLAERRLRVILESVQAFRMPLRQGLMHRGLMHWGLLQLGPLRRAMLPAAPWYQVLWRAAHWPAAGARHPPLSRWSAAAARPVVSGSAKVPAACS